jgi:hypothetical protein
VLQGDDPGSPLQPTIRSKACHLPFLPETLPSETTSANYRRHSRLARTSAILVIILLRFAPPTTPRLYARISHDPAQAHLVRLAIIVSAKLSSSSDRPRFSGLVYLSVLKRTEKESEPTPCMHLHLLFVTRSISACFCLSFPFTQSSLFAYSSPTGICWKKKKNSLLFGRMENLYSLPFLLEEKKK